MSKQIICTALAVFVALCIEAQSFGELEGKVVTTSNEPIPGAIVTAENAVTLIGTATDADGRYRLHPLPPGEYVVKILFVGMDSVRISGVLVNPDRISRVQTCKMHEAQITGPVVEISEYAIPLITIDASHLQTLTSKEMEHMSSANSGNLSKIVESMSSDIKPAARGGGFSVRGSREGDVLYFIDGVKVRNVNVALPSSGIHSVSLYTGGIPASYGDTIGGIVVVETKSYLQEYYKKIYQ